MTSSVAILARIQKYLQEANEGSPGMSEEIIQEAGESLKEVLRKTFNEQRPDRFTIRMSNAGRPTCQLQMERDKAPKETKSYSFRMKMLVGEAIEVIARAVLKASGVNVTAINQKVELNLDGLKIQGTNDIEIDDSVWDIKSSSNWSYKNKWSLGFKGLEKDDPFGYVGQLYGYAEAQKKKVGGWIVINKENGEWLICPAEDDEKTKRKHLKALEENVLTIIDPSKPFKRMYTDYEETFRKKLTGNRKLGFVCTMCDYVRTCWPKVKVRRAALSESSSAPTVYYTELTNEGV